MKTKQLNFSSLSKDPAFKTRKVHGGSLGKGKRKLSRPISTKKWMHLTLKASLAEGHLSLLNAKHRLKIDKIIKDEAKANGITIADGVNMGNHFHLKIKTSSREGFQRFLRLITGRIAMLVTKAKKGEGFREKYGRGFWDELAFSRDISSNYELMQLRGYFKANRIERLKGHVAREAYLNQFNRWIQGLKENRIYS